MIAILLGVLGLFMCGPLTSVPGAILAWMDMNEAKQTGQPAPGLATIALWGNIAVTVIAIGGTVLMMFMMMLMSGM